MKSRFLSAIIMVLWAFVSIAQNDVGIGTTNPAARLDVRGNGINYDVFNASNDIVGPLDSILSLSSLGHLGIGTTNTGNYKLVALGRPSAFSPQIEVWNGNPNLPASSLLADINDVGGLNGSLNLYLAGTTKKVQIRAQGVSYFTGGGVAIGVTTPAALFDVAGLGQSGYVFWAGNDIDITPDSAMILNKIGHLGLGTKFPQERLHVNGALVVGGLTSSPTAAGTISFNGTNFFGFNGTSSVLLDVQQDGDWITQTGMSGVPTNYNLCPGPVAVSSPGYLPPVPISDYGYLYVNNNMPPTSGTFSHLLLIDEKTGNFNSSQGYLITNWQQTGINKQYSQGMYNADASFKISRAGTLQPTVQGDNVTMVRYNPSGITDLPNQSRVRAFQVGTGLQVIPPTTWTPVNFTDDFTAPQGFDQQAEFTTAGSVNAGTPFEQAFFTAKEDGYYQVNARCEFNTIEYFEDQGGSMPVTVNMDSYVSIAIYTGISPPVAGGASPWAIGNNLQIGYQDITPSGDEISKLKNNNAPNVSDVVFLMKNQTISIWVYHSANTPMNLFKGKEKLYVSIHKVS
jgi:hypothetical protein